MNPGLKFLILMVKAKKKNPYLKPPNFRWGGILTPEF
jgi:hypothetical protein